MTPALFVEPVLPHVVPFAAALARVLGMFLFAPALGGAAAPARARALVILATTAAIYPLVAHRQAPTLAQLDLLALAPMLAGELLVGLVIGVVASLPVISVQAAGTIISHKMGLRLGDAFNPAIELGADGIGQLLFYLAIVAFLTMGGAEALTLSVAHSFERIPIGGASLTLAPLALVVSLASSGLELALRVAAPVITILFLEMVASGMIMKTMPQLNILTFGFAIKILVGLLALVGSMAAVQAVIQADVGAALDAMTIWARQPIAP